MQHPEAPALQTPGTQTRVLVAGIGNIFRGDDGFGPEVITRLIDTAGGVGNPGVRLVDYGIRGLHLALDLLDGVDALILVDALPAPEATGAGRDEKVTGAMVPGSIRILAIGPEDIRSAGLPFGPALDPHGMDPFTVLKRLSAMGGFLPLTYLVGCTVASIEDGIGLSREVSRSVPAAVAAVRNLIATTIPARLPAVAAPAANVQGRQQL
ncbi:hydrogenase maturation protease [Paenarthrobacter sp. Z7-10]|nr:hydrogenase maturation protease [Paenarthrobacter sp. Z7-10]